MSDQQQTISVPSLLLLAAVTALTIRYFFFKKSDPNSTSSRNPRAARPADVEQIANMFPQLGRREIIWDLQRNGGSVAATTERVLARGGLETPPPSFQPPVAASMTHSTATMASSQPKQDHIDLITRYKLADKISSSSTSPEGQGNSSPQQAQTWSNNKNERQALFQRRREEMILNARRKLEEKERGKKEQESQG